MDLVTHSMRRSGTGYAGMATAATDPLLSGCAEARRLIGLANQHLRVLDPDAARDLLQAALDALPQRAKKTNGAERLRSRA